MKKRVVVVGAGVGGLATALRLAHRGHEVTVLEKTNEVGGRNRNERVNDCLFDGGPSLLMMLDPFRKLFADVGERMEDHLSITLVDPGYRAWYRDGSRIDATPNTAKMVRAIEELCGKEEASRYPGFLGEVGNLYHGAIDHFVRSNYSRVKDFAAPSQIKRILTLGMLKNLAKKVERRFEDPRLRMLFSFQTMYLGLSPYQAPWVYATLAYMEYGEGIWYPEGGLPKVSEVIAELALERGAVVRTGCPVRSIEEGRVVLENGEVVNADIVVCNADLPYARRELEHSSKPDRYRYSCSALVMYIDYEGELPEMLHHNVFFGKDFKENLDDIFTRLVLPDDPAFYACLSNRSEAGRSPKGHENLFLLVPVPHLGFEWTPEAEAEVRTKVFARLTEECGFDPTKIRGMKARSPIDWRDELNLENGAAFGISHDLFQSAFFRPSNVSKDTKGTYYVGASTVPGNGLPMVLISAELVEKRLIERGEIPDTFTWPVPGKAEVERIEG